MKLPYFTNKFKIENIWDGIFPYCLLIEKDPRNVNIVTAEVSKNTQGFVSGTSILVFHTIFTRIYVLLYYKFRDNKLFQSFVFSELKSRMGIYAKENNLKEIVHAKIDHILELDKLVEASKEEARKNPKPMFAYVPHSGTESDYLYVEYNEEELFRHMSRIIKELAERHDVHLDEADVWYNAKQVVHSLRDIKRPELMIERVASALVPGQIHNEHKGSQIILLSAYMMVRATREHSHFDKFIKKMESYALDDSFKWKVLQNIKPVKKWLDENLPLEEEYDYIGDAPKKELFSRSDVENALAEYKEKERTLRQELADKEKSIEELKKANQSRGKQIQDMQAQLKEAESRVTELQHALKDAEANPQEVLRWQGEAERLAREHEEMIVELLLPIFFNDERQVRKFLTEAKGQSDVAITTLVRDGVKNHIISSQSKKRPLWSILHAAKYYSASESNWNQQV